MTLKTKPIRGSCMKSPMKIPRGGKNNFRLRLEEKLYILKYAGVSKLFK